MSIIHCRECGKEASNSAKTCPHCGIDKPARWAYIRSLFDRAFWLVMVVLIGSAIFTERGRSTIERMYAEIMSGECRADSLDLTHASFVVNGEPDYGIQARVKVTNTGERDIDRVVTVSLKTSEGDFRRQANVSLTARASRQIEINFPEPTIAATNISGEATCSR